MARNLRIAAIAAVLLFFFSVPLAFIAYGALGGLIGGLMFLAPIMAVQYLLLKMMQRFAPSRTDEQED